MFKDIELGFMREAEIRFGSVGTPQAKAYIKMKKMKYLKNDKFSEKMLQEDRKLKLESLKYKKMKGGY